MYESRKDMSHKISVIIPVYNVENYIGKSIESVRNQSYENLQILIIDDGSTDNSGRICDELEKEDERIQVYHRKNMGVASARNFGIQKAQGEYIVFLDSDDWLEKDYCKRMVDLAIQHDADVVACNHRCIGEHAEKINNCITEDKAITEREECIKDYANNQFYVYVVWGKIYRKSMIQKLSFRNMKIGEDTCFILDMFSIMNKIYLTTYVGYNYLAREGAVTKLKSFGEKDIDRLRIIAYYAELCKGNYQKYFNFAMNKLYRQAAVLLITLYQNEELSVCKNYSKMIHEVMKPYKDVKIHMGRKLRIIIRLSVCSDILAKIYAKLIKNLNEG